jgi:hypothetical protein
MSNKPLSMYLVLANIRRFLDARCMPDDAVNNLNIDDTIRLYHMINHFCVPLIIRQDSTGMWEIVLCENMRKHSKLFYVIGCNFKDYEIARLAIIDCFPNHNYVLQDVVNGDFGGTKFNDFYRYIIIK